MMIFFNNVPGVHLDNLTTSEGLEWSGLGGQAGSIGRERLTSNDFETDLRLASRVANVGSPPHPMSPSLVPPPHPPPSTMIVNKDGGGSFFTTLVQSARKSVLDYAGNPTQNQAGQEDHPEGAQDSIPLAAIPKVSV